MEENKNLILTETNSQSDYESAVTGSFFAPLSQSWSYGCWQKISNRSIRNYLIRSNGEVMGGFQLVKYSLPLNLNYLYIPHGPVLKKGLSLMEEKMLLNSLQEIANKEKAIFIRIDPWPEGLKSLRSSAWREAPSYSYHNVSFQPRFEWVLNVTQKDDELLAKMSSHCRYNIKLAQKRGVKILRVSGKDLNNYFPAFYSLMLQTSKRNGFNLHPKKYYKHLFDSAQEKIELFFAEYEEQYLAVDLIYYEGNVANWIFGGSSSEHRNLQPTFLIQWQSILSAKEKGYKYYSFGGVYNPTYPNIYKEYQSITFYKKNYGGFYINYNPPYVYSPRPFLNWLYNIRRLFKTTFK